ncbi:hypothetical protein [uncultured Helicobacter sp.]|uniref:hypothetical protein n=1 Tax=uncultured Helicobacter sp. TaxID=175537 RepID=UPI003750C277
MSIKGGVRTFVKNSWQLLWWAQEQLRFGSFSPSVRSVEPAKSRVFVLGNGPSLIKDIADYKGKLACEDILMVNQSLASPLGFELKPRYYVLMDPAYFGILPGGDIDVEFARRVAELSEALERVDWEMVLFVPYQHYKASSKDITKSARENLCLCTNPKVHIVTFNAVELYSFKNLARAMYRANLAIPSGINVLIASLCCMIAVGYERIYLLGADSDWHKSLSTDSQNRVFVQNEHFYEDAQSVLYMPYTFAFIMQCMTEAFRAYQELGEIFSHITNCSSNSMIDAFPRASLDSVLGGGANRYSLIDLYRIFLLLYTLQSLSRIGAARCR